MAFPDPDAAPRGASAPGDRKADHLAIAAGAGIEHATGTGLHALRMSHRALPERSLDSVELTTRLLGRRLAAPLLISAMTGGTIAARQVNGRLIRAAAEHHLGIVLGSGRRLLEDPDLVSTYRPSRTDRPPLLLANLGGAQMRGPDAPERCERLVEMLDADGLSVHLNPLQEAVQPEGDTDLGGVLDGIARTVARLRPLPVVVKEVGFGLAPADVRALAAAGVAAVDVAGSGGTNWALIEGRRQAGAGDVAGAFDDWGIPTVTALRGAVRAAPGLPLIASGGLRDGVDCAKCLALGADACGIARPFLIAAQADRAGEVVAAITRQLRIATWLAGAPHSRDLAPEHLG